jgi:predicted RNA-binding protein YlqC (UPF0109 family)
MTQRDEAGIHEMLLSVVRLLADAPDEVQVEQVSGEAGTFFRVEANPLDVGRLIGRNGQTVRALEAIANTNREGTGRRIRLEIDGGAGSHPRS